MYTSNSKFFSNQLKGAVHGIADALRYSGEPNDFGLMNLTGINGQTAAWVMEHGTRWKDNDQVFQAFIMIIEDIARKERGAGSMTESEAKAYELLCLADLNNLKVLVNRALYSAAETDYYYEFEKDWG